MPILVTSFVPILQRLSTMMFDSSSLLAMNSLLVLS